MCVGACCCGGVGPKLDMVGLCDLVGEVWLVVGCSLGPAVKWGSVSYLEEVFPHVGWFEWRLIVVCVGWVLKLVCILDWALTGAASVIDWQEVVAGVCFV